MRHTTSDLSGHDEYLTVGELAARLKLKAKTVRNRMHDGTWQRGVHWFARRGIGPRFRWLAVVDWLEGDSEYRLNGNGAAYGPDIPPARRGRAPQPGFPDLVSDKDSGKQDVLG